MTTNIPNVSFLVVATAVLVLCVYRLYVVLTPNPRPRSNPLSRTCSLAVFLGSGGHSTEALQLLSSLDFTRYTPRTYFISEGDHLSAQKAIALEQTKRSSHEDYLIITVPRARRVHQSLFSTPPSALWSLLVCIYYLTITPIFSLQIQTKVLTDVLILNGPGTCTTLCIAVIFSRGCLLHALFMWNPLRVYARYPYRVDYFNLLLTGLSCNGPSYSKTAAGESMLAG